MDVYRTEEQQIESLKDWWKENGASVVLGIALGLGAIFGWRYWQAHRLAEAEVAAALYEKVIGSLQQSDEKTARGTALRIVEEFPGTGYAVFARLLLARLAVESGELEPAASHLDWALEHSAEPSVKREIRLRIARLRAAQQRYEEALALLNSGDEGEFAGSYDELRGDIELLRGNTEAARFVYERALANARSKGIDSSVLETKLDNLGRVAGS